MFANRRDAGRQLIHLLDGKVSPDDIVLAIPRGGVEVGYEIAKHFNCRFSMIVTRKLPQPDNPEAGFGAIAEDGSSWIFEYAAGRISQDTVNQIRQEQIEEIRRRIKVLRDGEPLPDLTDHNVVIVDDGIAMGSTMRASIECCRNLKASHIIAAAPVASRQTAEELADISDEVLVVTMPPNFRAVAQVYRHWYDVPDEEVKEIMKKWRSQSSELE